MKFDVVLMEPEHAGNVGAIARVMKNFGVGRLVVVNPKVALTDDDAVARSTHGVDVLTNAVVAGLGVLKEYDLVVGTTAKNGSEYNLARIGLTPHEMAGKCNCRKGRGALLVGRESSGLTNEELGLCDMVVTIPTSDFATLNISHAVGIILYELYLTGMESGPCAKAYPLATSIEKKILLMYVERIIRDIPWSTEQKQATQRILWRRIIGRMMLTKREVFGMIGFFRKLTFR